MANYKVFFANQTATNLEPSFIALLLFDALSWEDTPSMNLISLNFEQTVSDAYIFSPMWLLPNHSRKVRVVKKNKSLEFQKKQKSFPLSYVPIGCVPIFRPIREDLDPPIEQTFFKGIYLNIQRERINIKFFQFLKTKSTCWKSLKL